MTELLDIPIDRLHPHPDNPRLRLRDDVVAQIVAEITRSGFGREHALLVRPNADGWEILSGHHRHEAARVAGVATVPCWVREMDDDEAFMLLVLENSQGELDPLERGFHALVHSDRYRNGGVSAYAERVGMQQPQVSKLRAAADVARGYASMHTLLGHSAHLYEVSKSPRETWALLVDALIANGWSAADTKHHVDQIRDFDIPDLPMHRAWLPLVEVVEHHLRTREFSPRTVARLLASAQQTFDWIASNAADGERADTAFWDWLITNKGGESWQPRAVSAYLQRLIAEQFVATGWHRGDWRNHIAELDDGTVSLVLTDPPYGQGYRSDYRLDRRADHRHDRIAADDLDAPAELLEALEVLAPKLADDAHVLVFCGWAGEPGFRDVLAKAGLTLRGSLVWDKQATGMGDPETTFAPAHERILHAVKGSPLLFNRAPDVLRHRRCDSSRHPTEKPTGLLAELIEATTADGQLVADPFGGVASTAVAAKETGRRWWSCELDDAYYATGEERLL